MTNKPSTKAIVVRFPEETHTMLAEYAEACQTRLAPFARYALYQTAFNRLSSERSQLKMLKDALEKLELNEDQQLHQRKEIRLLEAKVVRFEELYNDLAAILYGEGGENHA